MTAYELVKFILSNYNQDDALGGILLDANDVKTLAMQMGLPEPSIEETTQILEQASDTDPSVGICLEDIKQWLEELNESD